MKGLKKRRMFDVEELSIRVAHAVAHIEGEFYRKLAYDGLPVIQHCETVNTTIACGVVEGIDHKDLVNWMVKHVRNRDSITEHELDTWIATSHNTISRRPMMTPAALEAPVGAWACELSPRVLDRAVAAAGESEDLGDLMANIYGRGAP